MAAICFPFAGCTYPCFVIVLWNCQQLAAPGASVSVGFTPAWARGTAVRGTHTREQYMPHYSSTSARALVGTLRVVVVFIMETSTSQSLQMVSEESLL